MGLIQEKNPASAISHVFPPNLFWYVNLLLLLNRSVADFLALFLRRFGSAIPLIYRSGPGGSRYNLETHQKKIIEKNFLRTT